MTTEQLTGLDALVAVEAQARELIKACEAAGFHGITIVDMVKGQMDFLAMEAAEAAAASTPPTFHSHEAALAYQARKQQV